MLQTLKKSRQYAVTTILAVALAQTIGAQTALAQRTDDASGARVEQKGEAAERADRLKQRLEKRAQSRPRLDPPPVGRPAPPPRPAAIDWAAVKVKLRETRARDSARLNDFSSAVTTPLPNPGGLRAVAVGNLPKVRAREVQPVRLPILFPAGAGIEGTSVQVIGQPNAYTAIGEAGDISVRISGTRKKLVLPRLPAPRARLRKMRDGGPVLASLGAPYVVTRSEASTDLSFSVFGAGYVLSIVCDEPETDGRCEEDDFIESLAGSMALLNAERAENAQ